MSVRDPADWFKDYKCKGKRPENAVPRHVQQYISKAPSAEVAFFENYALATYDHQKEQSGGDHNESDESALDVNESATVASDSAAIDETNPKLYERKTKPNEPCQKMSDSKKSDVNVSCVPHEFKYIVRYEVPVHLTQTIAEILDMGYNWCLMSFLVSEKGTFLESTLQQSSVATVNLIIQILCLNDDSLAGVELKHATGKPQLWAMASDSSDRLKVNFTGFADTLGIAKEKAVLLGELKRKFNHKKHLRQLILELEGACQAMAFDVSMSSVRKPMGYGQGVSSLMFVQANPTDPGEIRFQLVPHVNAQGENIASVDADEGEQSQLINTASARLSFHNNIMLIVSLLLLQASKCSEDSKESQAIVSTTNPKQSDLNSDKSQQHSNTDKNNATDRKGVGGAVSRTSRSNQQKSGRSRRSERSGLENADPVGDEQLLVEARKPNRHAERRALQQRAKEKARVGNEAQVKEVLRGREAFRNFVRNA
jgi:hypothetical protein